MEHRNGLFSALDSLTGEVSIRLGTLLFRQIPEKVLRTRP